MPTCIKALISSGSSSSTTQRLWWMELCIQCTAVFCQFGQRFWRQPKTSAPAVARVTLTDNLAALQTLLKLIYSYAATSQLDQLMNIGKQTFQDVVRLADKYDMPQLLSHFDCYLEARSAAQPSGFFSRSSSATVASAFSWAAFANSMGLHGFLKQCETFISKNASPTDFSKAEQLPADSVLRILHQILQQLQQRPVYRCATQSSPLWETCQCCSNHGLPLAEMHQKSYNLLEATFRHLQKPGD